jgi:TonB-linked SusC/RagA family outer membrane protein
MKNVYFLTRVEQFSLRRRMLEKHIHVLAVICFLFFSFRGTSQELITGTVKDRTGVPLNEVNVVVKNSNVGSTTDANGHFKIPRSSSNDTLVFSLVGYFMREVAVSGRQTVDVELEKDAKMLSDVVVVGYGSQKKVNLTGAVDQVGSEYFENRPVPNIGRALEGVIPNLNINYTSGRPTSTPVWNVRGLTSIGAGGEALILIDGVSADPRNINPEDVASVTVLKDAASAAIYGSRGAFGVILITTKNPGKSKPRITFSSSYSTNKPINKPDVVSDGYTWGKLYKETYGGWYDYSQTPSSIGSSGLPFSDSYLDSLKYRSEHPGTLPAITVNPTNGNYVYYGNTDWYSELYKSSIPSIENSISVSGGTDKVDYLFSGKMYKQEGIFNLRADDYHKYDFRAKGGIQATDWLKVNAGTAFSSYDYTDPFRFNIWQALNIYGNGTPLAMMYNPDGTLTQTYANSAGALTGGNNVTTKQDFQQMNAGFAATALKKALNIKGDISYWITNSSTDDKVVPISYSVKPGLISATPTSSLAKSLGNYKYLSYNLYSDYAKTFGKHFFKVLVGDNYEEVRYQQLSVSRDGLLIPDLNDFNLTVGDNKNIGGGGYEWANNGLFARMNYSFEDKYLLELNGRYDGSSKFPESKMFGFFPSVSVGWRISEEPFLKDKTSWLNELKLRGSYGSLGNSQISPYLYLEQLRASTSPVIIDGTRPAYVSSPSALADNFTWETATTFNGGLDFGLFLSRLKGSFDVYQRNTYDMVTPGPSLPAVFGTSVPRGNYADLETKGFELSLTWNDRIGFKKPLSYSVRVTLADNVSYITKYNNPGDLINPEPYSFVTNYYVGQRVGDIWGYTTEGLFATQDEIAKHADQTAIQVSAGNKPMPGDIKFKDLNGDGKVNKGNRTLADHGDWNVIGNSRPRYTYGFTTDLDWNNFSFSAFFQGVGKRDWYFNTTEFWGQYNVWYSVIPKHTLENNWSLNGGDPNSYWPRYRAPLVYGDRELQPQTKYLQDVSYLRLKNIQLGYSIPKKFISRVGIQNLQFYFSAQNIWTTSPLYKVAKGIDVENLDYESGQRYNNNNYPTLKTVTVGAKLTF